MLRPHAPLGGATVILRCWLHLYGVRWSPGAKYQCAEATLKARVLL